MEPVLQLRSTASKPIVVPGSLPGLVVCRFPNNRRNQGNTLGPKLSFFRPRLLPLVGSQVIVRTNLFPDSVIYRVAQKMQGNSQSVVDFNTRVRGA